MATWAFFAIYQSLVLYYFVVASSNRAMNSAGKMFGLWDVSTMAFTSVVVTVNLRLLMMCNTITRWHHISVGGSILAWFIFVFIYSGIVLPKEQVSKINCCYYQYIINWILTLYELTFFCRRISILSFMS